VTLATAVAVGVVLYAGLAALLVALGVRWARDALGGPR
jgi:hypothetical protein